MPHIFLLNINFNLKILLLCPSGHPPDFHVKPASVRFLNVVIRHNRTDAGGKKLDDNSSAIREGRS